MATQTYIGTITSPAGTGSQSITGVGFQPKAVIFWSSAQGAAGGSTQAQHSIGFAVSSTSEATIGYFSRHNINPTQSARRHTNASSIATYQNGAIINLEFNFTSMDADGFTISWTTTIANLFVSYMAIGGDLTNVAIKELTSPAGTGSQSYTGVGFQPTGMMIIGSSETNTPPHSSTTACDLMIGFCDSTLAQNSVSIKAEDAVATLNSSKYTSSTSALSVTGLNETVLYEAAATAVGSDGFTLNWTTTAGSGAYFWALCFGGINVDVGSFTQKTSTGTQAYTGIGFQTRGVLFSGGGVTSTGSAASYTQCFGAMAGTGEGHINVSELDNQAAPGTTRKNMSTTTTISHFNTSGAKNAEAAKSSFDSDGFTLNYSTADATARIFYYLALGDTAPAGGAGGGFRSSMMLLGVGG